MLKLIADENFDNNILRGLRRRDPTLDIVRVQDVGLQGKSDPDILEWAAQENCLLLTHDIRTIPSFVNDRLIEGKSMPGVVEVNRQAQMGIVIEDILLMVFTSREGEWEGQIVYLPF
jgi:predicted nuclease of predicted toxin-antitoxin system